jgi:monovalent cation/hydrogen antiporter
MMMTFFETLVALLAVAILLLRVTRRMHLRYPGILAAAGVAVAMLPGAPNIPIDSPTALALFIAPVLVDSAYDFPLGAARRMQLPLFFYAVMLCWSPPVWSSRSARCVLSKQSRNLQ